MSFIYRLFSRKNIRLPMSSMPQVDIPGVNIIPRGTRWHDKKSGDTMIFARDVRIGDPLTADRFILNGELMQVHQPFPAWCLHHAEIIGGCRIMPVIMHGFRISPPKGVFVS